MQTLKKTAAPVICRYPADSPVDKTPDAACAAEPLWSEEASEKLLYWIFFAFILGAFYALNEVAFRGVNAADIQDWDATACAGAFALSILGFLLASTAVWVHFIKRLEVGVSDKLS